MANINTELEQIRKAVYGREVRGSIANAIELINKEQISTSTAQTNLDSKFEQLIINAGNSNAEVVAARVKADGTQFDTLGKRLDKGDELHNALNNEVISARTDSKNVVHKNLKNRLDRFDSQLDTNVQRIQTIGNEKFKWIENNRAIITIMFDDGNETVYNNAFPILKSRKLHFCAAINMDILTQQSESNKLITFDNLQEMYDYGMEVMNHGATHKQITQGLPRDRAIYELKYGRSLITDYGYKCNGFVAPLENDNLPPISDEYKPLVAEYSDYSIYGYVYNKYQPCDKNNSQGMKRTALRDGVDKVKSYIDTAIENKDWLILWCHKIDDTEVSISDFTKICDYINNKINSGVCESLTMRETYENYSTMFSKGKAYSDNNKKESVLKTKNLLYNSLFYSTAGGWSLTKTDTNISLHCLSAQKRCAVILDETVPKGKSATISQKVGLDFLTQSARARTKLYILGTNNPVASSCRCDVTIKLYNNDKLLRTYTDGITLVFGDNLVDKYFNIPITYLTQFTHAIIEFTITKVADSYNKFEIYYPSFEIQGVKSLVEDNIKTLNICSTGVDITLETDKILDGNWYTLNVPGNVFSKNNNEDGIFTIKETGLYEVSLNTFMNGGTSTTGTLRLCPFVNGEKKIQKNYWIQLSNGAKQYLNYRTFLFLNANDKFELKYTKSFSDLTLQGGTDLIIRKTT